MDINNKSKIMAKNIASTMHLSHVGKGNYYQDVSGNLYNITLTSRGVVESRQWRFDCDYLISYDINTKNKVMVHKSSLMISNNPTMVGTNGIKYYNAVYVK